jgi:hypothetical protein
MRNQIFNSPGNEEAKLAKIPGDPHPRVPHWELYKQPILVNSRTFRVPLHTYVSTRTYLLVFVSCLFGIWLMPI